MKAFKGTRTIRGTLVVTVVTLGAVWLYWTWPRTNHSLEIFESDAVALSYRPAQQPASNTNPPPPPSSGHPAPTDLGESTKDWDQKFVNLKRTFSDPDYAQLVNKSM